MFLFDNEDPMPCAGKEDLFFPELREHSKILAAKTLCRECPKAVECLDYARSTEQTFGIWGGVNLANPREGGGGRAVEIGPDGWPVGIDRSKFSAKFCKSGEHEFTPENTVWSRAASGQGVARVCRACRRAYRSAAKRRKRDLLVA